MITVTLYSRKNCPLCDEAREHLASIQSEISHRLVEVPVDDNPDLFREYGERVPVVEAGPYRKFAPFTRQELIVTLGAARDRQDSLERIGSPRYKDQVRRGQVIDSGDKLTWWISRNYLWVLNLIILLYVGLPFLAPVFMKAGIPQPAKAIYLLYSPLCHELGFRSFFLFGEQPYYPRESAGIEGVTSFEEATNIDGSDLLAARNFVGNESIRLQSRALPTRRRSLPGYPCIQFDFCFHRTQDKAFAFLGLAGIWNSTRRIGWIFPIIQPGGHPRS